MSGTQFELYVADLMRITGGRRELMGLEVDLIAACRAIYRQSPACQFHGSPAE